MLRSRVLLAFAVCVLLSFVTPSLALTETLHIKDDMRKTILINSFGFAEKGELSLEIKKFNLKIPKSMLDGEDPLDFKLAFVVERSNEPTRVTGMNMGECFHLDSLRTTDADVISLSNLDWELINWKKTIATPGNYHIYFSNCVPRSFASFDLTIKEYNLVNGHINYLSIGEQSNDVVYFIFFGISGAMFLAWLVYLARHSEDIKTIHLVMATVLFFKTFALLFEAIKYVHLGLAGDNNGWAIVFYIFNAIKGLLMFAVIVLIGTGWSHVRSFLTERDKQIIILVLFAQLVVNVVWATMDATPHASYGWDDWHAALYMLDLVCCIAVLLPIRWSTQHLQQEAARDGRLAATYQRLKNFRSFYVSVIAYIYTSRIASYLLSTMIDYKLRGWVAVFDETTSAVFIVVTGYVFRPQPVNPYLALEADDDTSLIGRDDLEMASTKQRDEFDDDLHSTNESGVDLATIEDRPRE